MSAASMAATALRLINKNGKTIVYTSVVGGVYDNTTSKVASTKTPYTIKAIATDVGGSNLVNGTLVTRNDKSFLIAAQALPVDPKTNDIVTLEGFDYEVYIANPTYAGESAVTYNVRAKRA